MTRRIVFAVTVLSLLIAYIFADRWWEKRKEDKKTKETKLFDLKADDVEEITVQMAGKDEKVLVKEGEKTWKLIKPVTDLADEATVRSMTSKIEELNFERVIDEAPSDPSSYGFNPFVVRVAFKAKGKPEPKEFQIGEKTQVGYNQYLRVTGSPRILLTSSSVKSVYDRDLLSLRAKEVVRAERDTIQRLEFMNPKSPKPVVLRRTNEKWVADADPILDLDQESVKNVVRDLVNLRIRDFDDEAPKNLKKFGLVKAAAAYSVEWSTASGVASETVLFGDKVKDKDRFYAKQGSRATVFEVDKYTFDNLNKSLDDLKEKHPLRFNRFDLTALEVDTPSKSYALEKVDGVWTLTKPEKTQARAEVISDLLILLEDAEGKAITKTEKSEYGLSAPQIRVRMKEKEKSHPQITIGNMILKDGKDHVYIRNDGTGMIYLSAAPRIKEILRGLEDLKAPEEKTGPKSN
ncbi:MAG: DUF4340 domain-containing protein [Nitrospirae bacterium]|nr:DUF4340 domain-containing protein [Nitrospirota bacterium]